MEIKGGRLLNGIGNALKGRNLYSGRTVSVLGAAAAEAVPLAAGTVASGCWWDGGCPKGSLLQPGPSPSSLDQCVQGWLGQCRNCWAVKPFQLFPEVCSGDSWCLSDAVSGCEGAHRALVCQSPLAQAAALHAGAGGLQMGA